MQEIRTGPLKCRRAPPGRSTAAPQKHGRTNANCRTIMKHSRHCNWSGALSEHRFITCARGWQHRRRRSRCVVLQINAWRMPLEKALCCWSKSGATQLNWSRSPHLSTIDVGRAGWRVVRAQLHPAPLTSYFHDAVDRLPFHEVGGGKGGTTKNKV